METSWTLNGDRWWTGSHRNKQKSQSLAITVALTRAVKNNMLVSRPVMLMENKQANQMAAKGFANFEIGFCFCRDKTALEAYYRSKYAQSIALC